MPDDIAGRKFEQVTNEAISNKVQLRQKQTDGVETKT
jgi:hypothetical protein